MGIKEFISSRKNPVGYEEMSRKEKDKMWLEELRREDTDELLQDYNIFLNLGEKNFRGIAVYAKKKLKSIYQKVQHWI